MGQTLERATEDGIPACVHRVVPEGAQERASQVFLVRARAEAVLDGRALLGAQARLPALTVAQFFKEVYLQRGSANFASKGQGLPLANLRGASVREEDKSEAWKPDTNDNSPKEL